jgi:hypothetical protein
MDPYVEPHWLDVHPTLIAEARRSLNHSLPAGLVARVEERIAIESEEDRLQRVGPDVRVFAPSTADPHGDAGGVVIEAPFKLVVDVDPIVERFIRIIDAGGELVTVIEFVSPTNKRGPGLEAFRTKRAELLAAGVHLVEVDLVRGGNWRALMRPEVCPSAAVSLYRAIVRTSGRRRGAYLFPITLRDPLPEVPIPLRPTDQPVKLPLQAMFTAAYNDGRYDQTLDYRRAADPPLEGDDAEWAEQLLRDWVRR